MDLPAPLRALALALPLAACAAPGAAEALPVDASLEVVAVRADVSPVVDGVDTDPAWAGAPEVVVPLEGDSGPVSCSVRAAVYRGSLFLLLSWEDPTEDRLHKPWVRGADGAWAEGPQREDVAAVAFPMEGEFTGDMLSPLEATWDVWHWKAGRTDPSGYAMDRTHRMTMADPGGPRHAQPLPGGSTVYIVRPEDAGDPVTGDLPPPPPDFEGPPQPRFEALRPTGSAGDVLARGTWREGRWTLELARALGSVNPDDRDLRGLASIPFALALLDRDEDEAHAVSGVVLLRLPPAEPEAGAPEVPGEGWGRPPVQR